MMMQQSTTNLVLPFKAQDRHVLDDLQQTFDALTFRDTSEGSDASELEAPRSPVYATEDFEIFEDTPPQAKGDNVIDCSSTTCSASSVPPEFDTPQKAPAPQQSPHNASQQILGQVASGDAEDAECQQPAESPTKGGGADGLPELVALCAADLLDLWEVAVRSKNHRIICLLQKFGSMGPPRLAQAFFSPPQGAPPAPNAWPHRKTHTQSQTEPRTDASTPKDDSRSEEAAVGSDMPLPTIAMTMARCALEGDVETRVDGASRDLLNQVLRSSHLQSERRLPHAQAILKNFPAEEREKTLTWLFYVCAQVNFHDSVLHMAVVLLDRFCAALSNPIPLERLQLVTVSIISISLKMNGAVDENSKPPKFQDLLVHLSQQRFTLREIFMMEHEVLRFVGYAVSMTTAADFLDTLLLPHGMPDGSVMPSPVRCLAQFFLQLSLLDAPLHYRYSHVVLAAGAVYLALWCSQRGTEHVLALLEDVSICFQSEA